jgi:HlyD family secretion protein
MADLGRVRMRAMVVETDIGQVKPDQSVNVVVDAYPQRVFQGTVEKIEPQAVVDQSVTMFPVLVSITNVDGLLLPGMNGEVTMMVSERTGALTVPVDAIRTMREMPGIATALGFDPDSLRSQRRGRRDGGTGGPGVQPASGPADPAAGDSVRLRGPHGPNGSMPDSARRAQWRAQQGGSRATQHGALRGGSAGHAGRRGGGGTRSMPQFAVVKTDGGLDPRIVRIGISDYDNVEIVSGLDEGEEVLLLGVVQMEQERAALQSRIRNRVGGGVTQQSGSNQNRRSGGQ